jgi:PPOX class probable F420-dependent enzyme
VSRRDQIKMAPDEVEAFLGEQRVVICASNGRDGWPHLMPLWYLVRGADIWAWTYAKSQKVRNLERDPRVTLEVEDGEQYQELRGVMLQARTEIHRDAELVAEFGVELFKRYGSATTGDDFLAIVRAQAAKRVALQFVTHRITSWDHAKLGGVY